MPISYNIDEAAHLVTTLWAGTVCAQDLEFVVAGVNGLTSGWPRLLKVTDTRLVELLQMRPAELRDAAERRAAFLARNGQTGRTAVIANSDETYAMANVYLAQASFGRVEAVHIVENCAEAAVWLGLPDDTVRAAMTRLRQQVTGAVPNDL